MTTIFFVPLYLGAVTPQFPLCVPEVVSSGEADQPVWELAEDGEGEAYFVAGESDVFVEKENSRTLGQT